MIHFRAVKKKRFCKKTDVQNLQCAFVVNKYTVFFSIWPLKQLFRYMDNGTEEKLRLNAHAEQAYVVQSKIAIISIYKTLSSDIDLLTRQSFIYMF